MDSLALTAVITAPTTATTPSVCSSFFTGRTHFNIRSFSLVTRQSLPTKLNPCMPCFTWRNLFSFRVFAAKEGDPVPEFDSYDLMELKLGRIFGEESKLTLSKIMGEKANPDASYLEIEKTFYKNKGKLVQRVEVPFDVSSNNGNSSSSVDGLIRRPVPKKGFKSDTENIKLAQERVINKPKQFQREVPGISTKGGDVSNVILRKPSRDGDHGEELSKLRVEPNLSLNMKNSLVKEMFAGSVILRKPEPVIVQVSDEEKKALSSGVDASMAKGIKFDRDKRETNEKTSDLYLLEKPDNTLTMKVDNVQAQSQQEMYDSLELSQNDSSRDLFYMSENRDAAVTKQSEDKPMDETIEVEQHDPSFQGLRRPTNLKQSSDFNSDQLRVDLSVEAVLQRKPKPVDASVKPASKPTREDTIVRNTMIPQNIDEAIGLPSASLNKEVQDSDWTKAEYLVKTGDRGEVELISASSKGFVASFGSLIGFLPYRYLGSKWKFLAFEAWLRRKGLDPSTYMPNLGILTSSDAENMNFSFTAKIDTEVEDKISRDMKVEDMYKIYDQEKLKFLSSFIGQKIKVNLILVDRESKNLIFSTRPKENEELVAKKRSLMARLQVGDIVKCCIQRITYFGIFVEVEGIPALIHQTEVSWDATLDPALHYKLGQVVEAKVHQLDFTLDRIFLSLREIMPDPLKETLESVIGDANSFDGRLEAAQKETEWPEVESLINELQQIDGIQSVSKGRFLLSPGLAPTFQVYMASIFDNQYKLLARSGNKVQEVLIQTSLDEEGIKSVIQTCTNRV